MILFTLALYGISVVLALVTVWVGVQGAQFYWTEVVRGGATSDQDRPAAEGREDG